MNRPLFQCTYCRRQNPRRERAVVILIVVFWCLRSHVNDLPRGHKLLGFFSLLFHACCAPPSLLPPRTGEEGRVGLQHQHPVEAREARLQQGVDGRPIMPVQACRLVVFAGREERTWRHVTRDHRYFSSFVSFSTGGQGRKRRRCRPPGF